jgi:hypothetical protein
VKLDPTPEEEEDPATDVVIMQERKDSHVVPEFREKVVVLDLDHDDDGASTLVGHDHSGMFGEKEVEMEVTDSEGEDNANEELARTDECGVKRKRTIRVIIRSRAFL